MKVDSFKNEVDLTIQTNSFGKIINTRNICF